MLKWDTVFTRKINVPFFVKQLSSLHPVQLSSRNQLALKYAIVKTAANRLMGAPLILPELSLALA